MVQAYAYDDLDRLTFIGFGETAPGVYESTINYTYDAGDRVRTVVDSLSGTITLEYDNFDRLLSETSSRGTVAYTYDKVGRRATMTVPGQALVNYAYNNADRLIAITQGTATVSFIYDENDRLATKTLPNGVLVEYDYDAASQLTGITYKLGESILGDLTYQYDQAGRRTRVGGSYARISLPQPLALTTFNDANRLTQREATTLIYDAEGNLTGDGTNTYVWNARNQLASISGGVTASFQYDSFGRRVSTNVNGTSIGYLYDGADVVQEQSGGAPSANLLVGGLDMVFSRTDGAGTRTLLRDGLGSTLGLTNNSGALQTEYTYDPFGNTTTSGAPSNNRSHYTGRENDGTGLYFYRFRYYSPTLQRFISEDPLGFAAGDTNLYAYVSNDPINFADPMGLEKDEGFFEWLNNTRHRGFWANTYGMFKQLVRFESNFFPVVNVVDRAISVAEGNETAAQATVALAAGAIVAGKHLRKLNNIKRHTKRSDLDAARRELAGEVVACKSNGVPYDHVTEVRDAQKGLLNLIEKIKKDLSNPNLTRAERETLTRTLGEASRRLDHTEGFVPR